MLLCLLFAEINRSNNSLAIETLTLKTLFIFISIEIAFSAELSVYYRTQNIYRLSKFYEYFFLF